MSKPKKIDKNDDITDPRLRFLQYCRDFPIDNYNIPRPLKSNRQEISNESCVHMALSYLGVSNELWPDKDLQPIGWLLGPHLLDLESFEDYSLDFCSEPLKTMLSMNPWILITESPVQLAVAILRAKCNRGNPRESRFAKSILKELHLELFLSEAVQVRRTDDIRLNRYKNYPDILAAQVALYKFVIKKYFNPPYKGDELLKKIEDIGKAFKIIFQQDMPNDLIIWERDQSPSNIALAFISHETSANYESLKKIFYEETKNVSESDIYHNLDFITDNKGDKISFIDELKRKLHGIDSER